MKKRILTVISALALCAVLLFGFTACGKTTGGTVNLPALASDDKADFGMWKFDAADKEVGEFMTDFYARHIRNADDKQIHNLNLGLAAMFIKDWEAYSLMWADTTTSALKYDGHANIRNYVNNIPVDRYGYVWQTFQTTVGAMSTDTPWGPNWAFPTYDQDRANGVGFEFNGADVTPEIALEGWSVNGGNEISVSNGLLKIKAKGEKNEEVELISPTGLSMTREFSPFAHVDFRISASGRQSEMEDILLYYRSDGENWSDEKSLSLMEDANFEREELPRFLTEAVYYPCYLKEDFEDVDQVKFVFLPKDNEKISSNISVNYIRFDFDARQANDNGIYLNTLKTYLEFTDDMAVLENNLVRARNAMLFLTKTLGGEENNLIDQSYFMGHDGVRGNGHGIGNGYWDIISTPAVSFYANVFYVKALRAMIWIEERAAKAGISTEDAYIYEGNLSGELIPWAYSTDDLKKMLNKTVEQIRKPFKSAVREGETYVFNYEGGFWSETAKRFVEGVNAENEIIDYGFVSFNLEAIYEDIPTGNQARDIMDWISGNRIVEGDTAQGYRGNYFDANGYVNEDVDPRDVTYGIYDYDFAPRSTTKHNQKHYVWPYNPVSFGKQVQNGGAIIYTSFYDIMARIKVYGADNAFQRLREIKAWYSRVQADFEEEQLTDSSWRFYRPYYNKRSVTMQGGGTAGGIGLDYEFLESALFYACIPYGFFGISGTDNTLTVAPQISSAMGELRMQNMMFDSVKYDVTATCKSVMLSYVRGITTDKFVTVALDAPAAGQAVYNNYRKLEESEYSVKDGKVYVTLPLAACYVIVE